MLVGLRYHANSHGPGGGGSLNLLMQASGTSSHFLFQQGVCVSPLKRQTQAEASDWLLS